MILCNTHFLVYRYTQVFAVMLCNSARPECSLKSLDCLSCSV